MIGYDFDGVIFNLGPIIAEEASKILGRNIDVSEITKYGLSECLNITEDQVRYIINSCWEDKWFQNNYFISGALDGLELMGSLNIPISVISARPHPERIKKYLLTHLDMDPTMINVYYAQSCDKGALAKDLNMNMFVDDHFVSLDSMSKHGILPLLFDAPWNQEPTNYYYRIKSWEEIKEIILELGCYNES